VTVLLRLYPRSWSRRYGAEMEALLEARPPNVRERVDLVRGALDAWLHPARPSRVPALAALVGGGLWTAIAAGVLAQPTQADWPGYVIEILIPGAVAAAILLIATLGCALRSGDTGGRVRWLAVLVTLIGYAAWIATLIGTVGAIVDSASLAAAQSMAMVGTALVALVLIRANDVVVGSMMLVGSTVMLIPSTIAWIALGVAWNAVGWILLLGSRGSGVTLRPT
jgi:hypothetical protein